MVDWALKTSYMSALCINFSDLHSVLLNFEALSGPVEKKTQLTQTVYKHKDVRGCGTTVQSRFLQLKVSSSLFVVCVFDLSYQFSVKSLLP